MDMKKAMAATPKSNDKFVGLLPQPRFGTIEKEPEKKDETPKTKK